MFHVLKFIKLILKYREFSIVQSAEKISLWSVKKKGDLKYHINEAALLLIGSKMRELRRLKGVSIETLANTSGMDYSQLARMEGGKVNFTISYLFRVAEALGVTPKDLLP